MFRQKNPASKKKYRPTSTHPHYAATYGKHFEQLKLVSRPTLLRLVYGKRQLDIPGVLREKEDQENGAGGKRKHGRHVSA